MVVSLNNFTLVFIALIVALIYYNYNILYQYKCTFLKIVKIKL